MSVVVEKRQLTFFEILFSSDIVIYFWITLKSLASKILKICELGPFYMMSAICKFSQNTKRKESAHKLLIRYFIDV